MTSAHSRLADPPPEEGFLQKLGPGVITGAADDDPSGIATYSQAGAQAGFGLLWTVVLTWPLMVAVQSVSARIGRVTGRGLARNMGRVFPRSVVTAFVLLLFLANTINIGADLAAMGAAARLMIGAGNAHLYTAAFAIVSLLAVVFIPYSRYVGFLKWLTFSLFAYVGIVFTVKIDWSAVAVGAFVPKFDLSGESLTLIVAILGTTISPYLFFWQSSQEVEEEEADPEAAPLVKRPDQAEGELNRISFETWLAFYCEQAVDFSVGFGMCGDSWFNGLLKMFDDSLKLLPTLPSDRRDALLARLERVSIIGRDIGYGVGDELSYMFSEFKANY
jgi:NRAMP (natural resistance-associated macrophage protein)-like metal ion transporter